MLIENDRKGHTVKHNGLAIKFLLFLLVLGFCGMFVLKTPDGRPWLSPDDFVPNISLAKLWPINFPSFGQEAADSNVEVYRWRNAQGHWVYSDAPPADGKAEKINVNTQANRDLYPSASGNVESADTATPPSETSIPTPTIVSPADVATLVDDARNVQEVLDQRERDREQLLSQ